MHGKNLLTLIIVFLLAGTVSQPAVARFFHAADFTGWIDEFDLPTLNARWSWVREDPALWSLTSNPGSLFLTANGTLYADFDDAKNILLTNAPDGDFRLITHLTLDPMENYQVGGLIVYDDDDHYLSLTRDFSSVQSIEFNKNMDADWSNRWAGVDVTEIYLRIDRRGNEYQGFYSTDGSAWFGIGAHTIAFTAPRIGVFGTVSPGPTFPILVHHISLSPLDAQMPAMVENFNGSLLPTWSWVREVPGNWSLTANPGKLRIVTMEGSLYSYFNDGQNILLRNAPNGDFSLTTRLEYSPTEFLHSAGLIVYQDDDNYIHLSRGYSYANIIFSTVDTASQPYTLHSVEYNASSVYLRIDRDGTRYHLYFCADGVNWEAIGSTTESFTNPKIGLAVFGNASQLHPAADFDYLNLNMALPKSIFLPALRR